MDRKEAVSILENNAVKATGTLGGLPPKAKEINSLNKQIEALNMAIEALQEPERKKGQWIILSSNEDSAVCKCSVCGEDFVFYEGEYFPNYCGDCGSDMREVRKNDKVSL